MLLSLVKGDGPSRSISEDFWGEKVRVEEHVVLDIYVDDLVVKKDVVKAYIKKIKKHLRDPSSIKL
jgi:nitrogen regulatory protein PII